MFVLSTKELTSAISLPKRGAELVGYFHYVLKKRFIGRIFVILVLLLTMIESSIYIWLRNSTATIRTNSAYQRERNNTLFLIVKELFA